MQLHLEDGTVRTEIYIMALSNLSHSLLAILVFGIFHGVKSAPYPVTVGGSSAIRVIFDAQVKAQSFISYAGGSYQSSNSLAGVNNFKSGKFDIAVSTVPFTASQETGFVRKKLTIPQGVFSLSPFHSSVPGVKLTAPQIANILRGIIQTWPSPASGLITPVLRKDPAGVVEIFTKFLQKAAPGWPSKYVGDGPFTFGNSRAITASGAGGVAALLKTTRGGFGFGQSGVYSNAPYNLKEIAVKNRAGVFVTITGSNPADVLAALPRTPPGAYASWSGVSLVWQPGLQTYPIASVAYVFYKAKYKPRAKRNAIVNFASFAQTTKGQALLVDYQFYPLPVSFRVSSTNALKTITVG